MTVLTTSKPITDCSSDPMLPNWAEILKIEQEAPGVYTYWMKFTDPQSFRRIFHSSRDNLTFLLSRVWRSRHFDQFGPKQQRSHWPYHPFDRQCHQSN